MSKTKFNVKSTHTVTIGKEELKKILIEVLELPENTNITFDTVERSDFRDQNCWTETVGIKVTYTN